MVWLAEWLKTAYLHLFLLWLNDIEDFNSLYVRELRVRVWVCGCVGMWVSAVGMWWMYSGDYT